MQETDEECGYLFVRERKIVRAEEIAFSRPRFLVEKKVSHGTPMTSLFLLPIMAAMASVLIREKAVRDFDPYFSERGVSMVFYVFGGIGGLYSILDSALRRLGFLQMLLRTLSGLLVGFSAAILALLPLASMFTITLAACAGSLCLLLVAVLVTRLKSIH